MSVPSKRRLVADALEVRWTPALGARTQRRINEAIARRRRRRRAVVACLALLSLGGVSFAFVRAAGMLRRRPSGVTGAISTPRAPGAAPVAAAPLTAEKVPPVSFPAPAPPKQAPRR